VLRFNVLAVVCLGLLVSRGPARAEEVALTSNVVLSPPSLDFGEQRVGTTSLVQTVRVSNVGSGSLHITSLAVGSGQPFAVSPSTEFTLAEGESQALSVTFSPTVNGASTGTLTLTTDDAGMPTATVSLSGTGVSSPELKLDRDSIFFDAVRVGSESAKVPVTVRNTGTVDVTLRSLSVELEFGQQLLHNTSSPRKVRVTNNSDAPVTLVALAVEGAGASRFTLAKPPLPLVLEPGQGQEVGVSFTPLAEAEVNGTLKLTFNELPQPLAVVLHGKGIPTVLSINPALLDFGWVRVGDSKREQPLTLTNLSSEPIVLAAPEVAYQIGEPFSHDMASL